MAATGTGKDPSQVVSSATSKLSTTSTQPLADTSSLTSVPQTPTPALLRVPFFAETASGHAIYRLRCMLISLPQVVSMSFLIVIGFVILLGLPLALCATIGAIVILTGNSFLRNSESNFTNNASAASIGVVGSLILSPPLYLLYLLIPPSPGESRSQCLNDPCKQMFILIVFPSYSTIIGVIGSSILLYCRVDLGGIDIPNATLAASYGGLVFTGPAMVLGFRFLPLLISVIISLSWSGIMRCVQWIHVKLTEIWIDGSHYGSREGDPEINIGFQIPPGRD